MTLVGCPIFSKHSSRPYIQIFTMKNSKLELIYDDKIPHKEQKKFSDLGNRELNIFKIQILKAIVLYGDILIRVVHNGRFNDVFMFRFAFNTAFIPDNNIIIFELKDLDPD